jgi:hypothetical protein
MVILGVSKRHAGAFNYPYLVRTLLLKIPEFLYVQSKAIVVQHWGCEPQIAVRIVKGPRPRDGSTKNWKEHTFKMCGWKNASGLCLG